MSDRHPMCLLINMLSPTSLTPCEPTQHCSTVGTSLAPGHTLLHRLPQVPLHQRPPSYTAHVVEFLFFGGVGGDAGRKTACVLRYLVKPASVSRPVEKARSEQSRQVLHISLWGSGHGRLRGCKKAVIRASTCQTHASEQHPAAQRSTL